ncbi:hypothetical protein Bca52824_018493 [Brassica carinata]|uniref:Uncharacterized protein n=1 Tax=Brassica carinata TaxID=52824 RepID=A0A8X7VQ48_BRACI|nr:hypothetical protein Bca52824_018493 [Brassica carinata]
MEKHGIDFAHWMESDGFDNHDEMKSEGYDLDEGILIEVMESDGVDGDGVTVVSIFSRVFRQRRWGETVGDGILTEE